MGFASVRKGLSKLFKKLPMSLRNAVFLSVTKKVSLVKILIVIAVLMSSTVTIVAFSLYSPSFIIRSGGKVNLPVGVGFYWDSNCVTPVSFIDWGTIEPGSTNNVTFFARNEGSQAISLLISAENWQPIEATDYMTFTSEYSGHAIDINGTIQITLSLVTSSSIEGIPNFSFDINVVINRLQ